MKLPILIIYRSFELRIPENFPKDFLNLRNFFKTSDIVLFGTGSLLFSVICARTGLDGMTFSVNSV